MFMKADMISTVALGSTFRKEDDHQVVNSATQHKTRNSQRLMTKGSMSADAMSLCDGSDFNPCVVPSSCCSAVQSAGVQDTTPTARHKMLLANLHTPLPSISITRRAELRSILA
eukprot:scpid77122/ scgid13176/ 